jgi:cytochrome P450
VRPMPPIAQVTLPWHDPDAAAPAEALAAARAALGDTFVVRSGGETTLFVFSPEALAALYELPEREASKGLADYTMLVRKLPDELFAGPRTFAHDLFGASEVESYLGHLDHALDIELGMLAEQGTFEIFEVARRLGHRLGLACWIGDRAAESPWFDRLVSDLELLDGAEAFVHPERMSAIGELDRPAERAALARFESTLTELRGTGAGGEFLEVIASRWDDEDDDVASSGIACDVVLLHVATMTNLFAALGHTIAQLAMRPSLAAAAMDDPDLLDRCISEAIRLGQRSIMMRTVLRPIRFDDGTTTYDVDRGVVLATTLAVTNTTELPDGERFDPDRWTGRRLVGVAAATSPESVVTFGVGPHRCPAQRFSRSAIARTVRRLVGEFRLTPEFETLRPVPGQIGGVGRAADPCVVAYQRIGPAERRA